MDEDIIFNDLDDNDWEYSLDAYWESIQIGEFEAYMEQLKYDIQEEKKYSHIKDAADEYYEQLELEEQKIEEDARKDAMYRLLETIEGAKEFGCEHDFAWEGIDLLHQESIDDHCSDGDPSQWDY